MKKIAVLISNAGTGTNLQAIINAVEKGIIKGEIAVVISGNDDAHGLIRAKNANIPTLVIDKTADLTTLLTKEYPADYVALAGWKRIIPDDFITAFSNRILNTHPGLIPDSMDDVVKNPDGTNGLWNKGKMTTKAMQNFLDSKATYAGCTNHFLTLEFDFGPVLGRCFEKIKSDDTVDSLYTRLKVKENALYVDVLAKLCNE